MTETIAKVIKENRTRTLPEARPRDVRPFMDGDHICDIIGPRRAGKTYLMFLTMKELTRKVPKEAVIYLNLEDRRLLPLRGDCFNDLVAFIHQEGLMEGHGKVYLFLDEVQRVDGWERYIRSIHDEFKGRIKIFVSGSSAHLLGKECSRLLTGRHVTTQVFPLSFNEYLAFQGMDCGKGTRTEKEETLIKRHLKDYLLHGGFPEVVLAPGDKDLLISQLFSDIVARDILSRTDVRNKVAIDEFARFLGANVSNLLSFGKMARYFKSRGLKVSVPTLIRYFEHMKDAFLFFDHTIFSYSVRDRMQYPRKIYCVDTGLARTANPGPDEGWGPLCENAVAVDMLRRNERVNYWKARNGEEVDFILQRGKAILPVQVCYDLDRFGTKERETKALVRCMEEFKVKDCIVVNFDHEGKESIDGKRIAYVPLWKFLMGQFPKGWDKGAGG